MLGTLLRFLRKSNSDCKHDVISLLMCNAGLESGKSWVCDCGCSSVLTAEPGNTQESEINKI